MINRRQGEAGQQDDKHIVEFMKLVEIMEDQRSTKISELHFRENYRKRSMNNGAKVFSTDNFILPGQRHTKTNVLSSSSTFRTLTAQKLSRHAASNGALRKSGALTGTSPGSFASQLSGYQ